MSIVPFFKNAPLSRQFLHKLEVFCWKILVKAKKSAVPFLSNCCLKIFFELFLGFSMYLMFKIKIFKMQLLKNYTANPVNSTWSSSIVSSFFRKNCPIRGAFFLKINLKKNFMLIGRRVLEIHYRAGGPRTSAWRHPAKPFLALDPSTPSIWVIDGIRCQIIRN